VLTDAEAEAERARRWPLQKKSAEAAAEAAARLDAEREAREAEPRRAAREVERAALEEIKRGARHGDRARGPARRQPSGSHRNAVVDPDPIIDVVQTGTGGEIRYSCL